jgi:hypothetical protein
VSLFKLALQFAQLTRTESGAVATKLIAATRCAAPSVVVAVVMVIVLLLMMGQHRCLVMSQSQR